MRSLAIIGILFGGLAVFSLITSGAGVPPDWKREWPRTDFTQHVVPFSEIVSGGPPKDGIPSIDDPRFEPAGRLTTPLAATEPVMSVEIGGDARGYPLSILIWHEVVNDTVGGVSIAVTYCPLCNSGVVFDRTVAGEVTSFGTTGKLRNSDLVMYDRTTESWWQQYEGLAIAGARAGHLLEKLPVRLESFREFRERHPDGLVLVPGDAVTRAYGRNPYVGYDTSAIPFFYQGDYDGPGSPLMRVVTVEGRDEAWSLDFLRDVGTVTVGDLRIGWRPGQNSALDTAKIGEGRDVGTVTVQRSVDGELTNAVYHVPFAFAFRAFHPDAPIHHAE
jgi:hypothetical protein